MNGPPSGGPFVLGPVAQWLERGTHNPLVVGSIPTWPTSCDLIVSYRTAPDGATMRELFDAWVLELASSGSLVTSMPSLSSASERKDKCTTTIGEWYTQCHAYQPCPNPSIRR